MYYTKDKAQRYIEDLKKFIYEDRTPINNIKFKEFTLEEANQTEAYKVDFNDTDWNTIEVGDTWGGRDAVVWFRGRVEIPADWKSETIALYFILGVGQEGGLFGTEALIYIDGQPVQGLDHNHKEVYLKPEWVEKGYLEIAIKAWSGLQNAVRVFKEASLVKVNKETEDFFFRAATILMTLDVLKEGNFDREQLMNFLNESINLIDFRKPGSKELYASIEKANIFLKNKLKEYRKDENRPVVTAIGHSHIDVAWLWRLCHTRENAHVPFLL